MFRTKRCGLCNKVKHLSDFTNCTGNKDGKQDRCRECIHLYAKFRKEHPEYSGAGEFKFGVSEVRFYFRKDILHWTLDDFLESEKKKQMEAISDSMSLEGYFRNQKLSSKNISLSIIREISSFCDSIIDGCPDTFGLSTFCNYFFMLVATGHSIINSYELESANRLYLKVLGNNIPNIDCKQYDTFISDVETVRDCLIDCLGSEEEILEDIEDLNNPNYDFMKENQYNC